MMTVRMLIFSLLSGLLLLGCAASPVPQRYVLEPLPATGPAQPLQGATIALGRLTLPAYLNRQEIVRRDGNQLMTDSYQMWAEPLSEAVPRVLRVNLSHLLPQTDFVQWPWSADNSPDWKVFVQITRLEAVQESGRREPEVQLDASWRIVDMKGKTVVNRQAGLTEPATSNATAAIVAAHNAVLGHLARQVSEDIRQLPAR